MITLKQVLGLCSQATQVQIINNSVNDDIVYENDENKFNTPLALSPVLKIYGKYKVNFMCVYKNKLVININEVDV